MWLFGAEPQFWYAQGPCARLLSLAVAPLSGLYWLLERTNRFSNHRQHPDIPVICVGNLTVGGAGKTPTVRWLAETMCAAGHKPAILSRGYGGSEAGPLKIDPNRHTACHVGDEPLMLATHWPVYIGRDRFASLRLAQADGTTLAIKDDGFQNPKMAHHFNLVVIDGASGLGNGRLLPAGPLRQPRAVALAELDALLVLGPPTHASIAPLITTCKTLGKAVFHGQIIAQPAENRSTENRSTERENVFAYCGIAKPEKFFTTLRHNGYRIIGQRVFADHHYFTEAEAKDLLTAANDAQLITTEKDRVRLIGAPQNSARTQLADASNVLPIGLQIETMNDLLALIGTALSQNRVKRTNQADRFRVSY